MVETEIKNKTANDFLTFFEKEGVTFDTINFENTYVQTLIKTNDKGSYFKLNIFPLDNGGECFVSYRKNELGKKYEYLYELSNENIFNKIWQIYNFVGFEK